MLVYVLQCVNKYFRILHTNGLWLAPGTCGVAALLCQEMCDAWLKTACIYTRLTTSGMHRATAWTWCQAGYVSLAKACLARGYSLFRMRPKLHMQVHFSKPAGIIFIIYLQSVCIRVCRLLFARILLEHCFREGISCLNPLSAGLTGFQDVMCDNPSYDIAC